MLNENMVDEYPIEEQAIIKVIGVGGGGGNAIAHMITKRIEGVDFSAANTDIQALNTIEKIYKSESSAEDYFSYKSIILGQETTRGLGAGAKPEIGQKAVQESVNEIREYLKDTDMVFVTSGMGGGTGTGAAPVIARIAKDMGILTVGVVTKPFGFEGHKRMKQALEGIQALKESVDSLIVIPNDKLLTALGKNISLKSAFSHVNDVLYNAVHGISDLITRTGLINVDFADVKTVMSSMGTSMMGTGIATGDNRAILASEQAVNSPLLENIDIKGARGILINVISSSDISISEFNDVGNYIKEKIEYEEDNNNDVTIVIGSTIDEEMEDNLMVTLIATGVPSKDVPRRPSVQREASYTMEESRGRNSQINSQDDIEMPPLERQHKEEEHFDEFNVSKARVVKPRESFAKRFMRNKKRPDLSQDEPMQKKEEPVIKDSKQEEDDDFTIPSFLNKRQ